MIGGRIPSTSGVQSFPIVCRAYATWRVAEFNHQVVYRAYTTWLAAELHQQVMYKAYNTWLVQSSITK